jgi:transcriptional regulator with XRE-family HTH domain
MNYNKIGDFIESERKAKKLTQAKLAELIYVSEKTISKWENGNGIPDTNSLLKLCEIFGVSLNELLNGERMNQEEYKNKAEEELLILQKQKEYADGLLLKLEIVLVFFSLIFMIVTYLLAAYAIEKFNIYVLPIILMVVSFVLLIVACYFGLKIEHKAGYYVCKKCGYKHIPTYKQVVWSMHCGRTRYMSCPKCKEKSWQKKVIK